MLKSELPTLDITKKSAAPAQPRKVPLSARIPLQASKGAHNRESAARRTHRQRMKIIFAEEKPAN